MDTLTHLAKLAPYLQSGFLVLAAITVLSYVFLVRHVIERQKTITEPVLKAVSAYRWLPICASILAVAGFATDVLRAVAQTQRNPIGSHETIRASNAVELIRVPIEIAFGDSQTSEGNDFQKFHIPLSSSDKTVSVIVSQNNTPLQMLDVWCIPIDGIESYSRFHRLEPRISTDGSIKLHVGIRSNGQSNGILVADIFVLCVRQHGNESPNKAVNPSGGSGGF